MMTQMDWTKRVCKEWVEWRSKPQVREIILKRGFRPYPSVKEWDGFRVVDANESRSHVEESWRKEIVLLIAEGYYEPKGQK